MEDFYAGPMVAANVTIYSFCGKQNEHKIITLMEGN